jgi:hypothetical protein
VNGVVEVEAPKDEVPEADAPAEEGKEEGTAFFFPYSHVDFSFSSLSSMGSFSRTAESR